MLDRFTTATVVANTTDMDRAEWLEHRSRGIGGSDAAAIVGMSRWTSPFEVYLDKIGALADDTAGEAAEWGTLLEPIVRDRVAARRNLTIDPCKLLLAHEARPWQLANIDGDVPELDAIYEGKTANQWLASDWADDAIPDAYVLQGQHYLAVTGRARVLFGVLIGGQNLQIRVVERDQELIDHLISLEAEFWQRVEDRVPPAPDASKACTDLLAHLWDVKPGAVKTLDGSGAAEVEALIAERTNAAADVKAAEDRKTLAENQLKVLCGDAEVLANAAGQPLFTWKEQSRKGIDTKGLRLAHPEIADEFETVSTFRKVHVPKRKAA